MHNTSFDSITTLSLDLSYDEFNDTWDAFSDIEVISVINHGKYPVYLVESPILNQKFAMKVFPPKDGETSFYYKNEIRFSNLFHRNIVRQVKHNETLILDDVPYNLSYILSDHAIFGDF